MYKSVNGVVPSYISELTPPLISEITDYPLRNQNNITVPFSRTETARKSCIPSSITLWNSLDAELRNSSSVSSFKHQLKDRQNNSKVPSYYLSGNRFLSVLHARLRNNCSNLSSDLFRIFCLLALTVDVRKRVRMWNIIFSDAQTTLTKE